ncbi:MAG TPA: ribonuclease HI family protein [Candidatus Acidoferrales bacterium]|nr:ribonuclease HI family protein [Candidatus Acidoferrales bacterium]
MPEGARAHWLVMIDGAARGNPGPAGCGAWIRDPAGVVSKKLYRYLGTATNNVAEYEGLLMALEEALSLGARSVKINSDSELLVKQINGEYRVRSEKLKELHGKALGLLRRFERYRLTHIRREENRVADELANRAIDSGLAAEKRGLKPSYSKVQAIA